MAPRYIAYGGLIGPRRAHVGPRLNGVASTVRPVHLFGFAKYPDATCPHLLLNELVAFRVGSALGLPVAPGQLQDTIEGLAWISLSRLAEGVRPPPVNPQELVAANSHLAHEIVAFDILIGNEDRHESNIAMLDGTVSIFDHGHSLISGYGADDIDRHLRERAKRLLVDGADGATGHCLIGLLDDGQALDRAAERIALKIDSGFIDLMEREIMATRIASNQDAKAAMMFLETRVRCLREIVHAHASVLVPGQLPLEWSPAERRPT